MGNLKEKVAYLQGMTKGLNVNEHTPEGKLLVNMIDVLESFAEEINCMNVAQEELEDYVEVIDDDLTDLEDEIYDVDEFEEEEGLDDMVEVECPVCHEEVTFESELLDEDDELEVTCPNCGGVVYDNTLEFVDEDYDEANARHLLHPGI